mmetsp:Transcript_18279/g.52181  ORF Transcript_18279/g.52181 Transcript_18279/m.52181 type:complete len:242 (+) Transcript_18279:285-1010(+)
MGVHGRQGSSGLLGGTHKGRVHIPAESEMDPGGRMGQDLRSAHGIRSGRSPRGVGDVVPARIEHSTAHQRNPRKASSWLCASAESTVVGRCGSVHLGRHSRVRCVERVAGNQFCDRSHGVVGDIEAWQRRRSDIQRNGRSGIPVAERAHRQRPSDGTWQGNGQLPVLLGGIPRQSKNPAEHFMYTGGIGEGRSQRRHRGWSWVPGRVDTEGHLRRLGNSWGGPRSRRVLVPVVELCHPGRS